MIPIEIAECRMCAEWERDAMNPFIGTCPHLGAEIEDARGVKLYGHVCVRGDSRACVDFNVSDEWAETLAGMAIEAGLACARDIAMCDMADEEYGRRVGA